MQRDLALATKNTERFIEYRPVEAVVNRAPMVDDGAGGSLKGTPVALAPQKVRRVPTSLRQQVDTTEAGRVKKFDLYLVGMPGFDVQEGDLVDIEGSTYDVVFVSVIPEHRVAAGVVEVRDGS